MLEAVWPRNWKTFLDRTSVTVQVRHLCSCCSVCSLSLSPVLYWPRFVVGKILILRMEMHLKVESSAYLGGGHFKQTNPINSSNLKHKYTVSYTTLCTTYLTLHRHKSLEWKRAFLSLSPRYPDALASGGISLTPGCNIDYCSADLWANEKPSPAACQKKTDLLELALILFLSLFIGLSYYLSSTPLSLIIPTARRTKWKCY